jgi:hypothetical protein
LKEYFNKHNRMHSLNIIKNNFVQKPNTRWKLVAEEAKVHPGL